MSNLPIVGNCHKISYLMTISSVSTINLILLFRYPLLEVEFDLSPEEKRCVHRTLPIVQGAAATLGPSSILKMFETYPLSMVYFSDFRYLKKIST